MKIDVVSTNLGSSRALRTYADLRLRTALEHLDHRIRSVVVWLTDVNGPKGGRDTRCRVLIRLGPSGQIVLTERSDDAYRAIDSVSQRLKETVRRNLHRRHPRFGTKGEDPLRAA